MASGLVFEHFLILAFALFSIGALGFLVRRNLLVQLMSLELMLNAANLVLVSANRLHVGNMTGQGFAFFVVIVAVAELAVGLAVVISFYKLRNTVQCDDADTLRH